MKECPKCGEKYNDEFAFCRTCGDELVPARNSNKISQIIQELLKKRNLVIAIVIIAVAAVGAVGVTLADQKKVHDTKKSVEAAKHQKAVQEYISKPATSDLRVNSDLKTRTSGNYMYISGSVTNTSSTKTISYFEVEAKFYDSKGSVIDSDWTNESGNIKPGETKKFEIMHKYDSRIKDVKASVRKVS